MWTSGLVPVLALLGASSLALGQAPTVPDISGQPVPGGTIPSEKPIPDGEGIGEPEQVLAPEVVTLPSVHSGWEPPGITDPDCFYQDPAAEVPGPCSSAGPGLFSFGVEYLLWFFDPEEVPPPLLSTDPNTFLFGSSPFVQGENLRPTLSFDERPLSGARFTLGYWFPDQELVMPGTPPLWSRGIEVQGFFLGERSIDFGNDTSPELTRPFFDLNNRQESAFLIGAPGVATGNLFGSASVDAWGLEANGRMNVYHNAPGTFVRVDVLGGYRYMNFTSNLNINSQSVFANNLAAFPSIASFAGNRLDVTDVFDTSNDFHGGQVGARVEFLGPLLLLSTTLKFALGGTQQEIDVFGQQVRTAANGSRTTSSGGLYALPSNSGHFSRNRISLLLEANFNLAFAISKHCTIFGGYTVLGWTDVVRPVDQIDRVLDITQIPNFPSGGATPTGLGRPNLPFRERSLVIHGLNVGAAFTW
jgi:hypothetical protein